MDSKIVSASIRKHIQPSLKEAGFSSFTGRTSWRYHHNRIDVVNFQSVGSYNAEIIGCTSYSFGVNIGSYFLYVPERYPKSPSILKSEKPKPQEHHCHFRGTLQRSFTQQELARRDIWFVDEHAEQLEKCTNDALIALTAVAEPWFDRFQLTTEVLDVLLGADENMADLWGFGKNPSPIRHYMTGYVALNCGERELARFHLTAALASQCFRDVESDLENVISGL